MPHLQTVELKTIGAAESCASVAKVRKTLCLTMVCLCAITAKSNAHAGILSGPALNPVNGHSYYLLTKANWFDSQAEALTLGGNLVTINDAAENAWVYSTFSTFDGTNRGLWIGLNDAVSEGSFVWVSGETVTYTNWAPGEPNSSSDSEDYVHIESPAFRGPFWNDRDAFSTGAGSGRWGVVEVVPEPTTVVLLALGLIPLARATRRRQRSAARTPTVQRR